MEQINLFGDSFLEEPDGVILEDEQERKIWKKIKQDHRNAFQTIQDMEYEEKLKRQELIAKEFYEIVTKDGGSCHVSVGGLDSITLLIWLRSIGIDVPGVSVSGLEDISIQKVHRALGVKILHSCKSKIEVLNELGFPVIPQCRRCTAAPQYRRCATVPQYIGCTAA